MRGLSGGVVSRRIGRWSAAMLLLLGGAAAVVVATPADAQAPASGERVTLRTPGPGQPGRILRAALAQPHIAIAPTQPAITLPPDTTFTQGVVVIGADVYLESEVRGDVVVVGGDLFLRPGAAVLGRAIAYGGGVYFSLLARVEGTAYAFRDVTFVPTRGDGQLALDFQRLRVDRSSVAELPGIYGLRLPGYNRVDGAVLPWGPALAFGGGRLQVEPLVTYRSHLGVVDPSVRIAFEGNGGLGAELFAGRGTFTNDAWMRGDLVNSAATLVFGDDVRNYYRATRVEAHLRRDLTRGPAFLVPGIGGLTEGARSVGAFGEPVSRPWSAFGRGDTTRLLRANPPVTGGWISSALATLDAGWDDGALQAGAEARLEVPVAVSRGERFVQLTVDATSGFRTFGTQRLDLRAHLVTTAGDAVPTQRYAYLGGGATLATLDPLALGGDELLFVEGVYSIPLHGLALPVVGAPTVGVRYAVGSAGIGSLPSLTQNVGLRLALPLLRVDFMVDPASGDRAVGIGTSILR